VTLAVDTSALMAILLDESTAAWSSSAIEAADGLIISAGTVAESLIVADRRHVGQAMSLLIDGLGFEIVPLTLARAKRVAEAYARWGKGVHPAGLNFGDCFGYELAKEHDCPLLFVGEDFAKTDVTQVTSL
jgi:ribonuclease VapC